MADGSFVNDLASCRAVIATTGNQLLGEVIHYRKPMLCLPIDCMEQRINAAELAAMGGGVVAEAETMTPEVLREFLSREAEFAARLSGVRQARAENVAGLLERIGHEMVEGRSGATTAPGDAIGERVTA